MELHVWPADFGLPSIDVTCLQFLSCSKMCASPITVVSSTSPWNSPNGEYPVLIDKSNHNETTTDFDKFVNMLRHSDQEVVIDGDLTASERSKIDAFNAYLQQHLLPAVIHSLWIDELNYTTTTQYWYNSKLPFPYNMYYLEKRRKKAMRFLADKNVNQIMKNALQALNSLSTKLGDNKFMCGNKPSSLDALVFGYLAPLSRLPLPNDKLQLHLSACPNLHRFVESIISIYLPSTDEQLKQQSYEVKIWKSRLLKAEKTKEVEKEKNAEEEQTTEEMPVRDAILFGLVAFTLSAIFAIHSGIIQVVVEDDEPALDENS